MVAFAKRAGVRRSRSFLSLILVLATPASTWGQDPSDVPLPDAPGAGGDRLDPDLLEKYRMRGAAADEWDAEVFNELAARRLALLSKLLKGDWPRTLEELEKLRDRS